jgi:hypothetical protein
LRQMLKQRLFGLEHKPGVDRTVAQQINYRHPVFPVIPVEPQIGRGPNAIRVGLGLERGCIFNISIINRDAAPPNQSFHPPGDRSYYVRQFPYS